MTDGKHAAPGRTRRTRKPREYREITFLDRLRDLGTALFVIAFSVICVAGARVGEVALEWNPNEVHTAVSAPAAFTQELTSAS